MLSTSDVMNLGPTKVRALSDAALAAAYRKVLGRKPGATIPRATREARVIDALPQFRLAQTRAVSAAARAARAVMDAADPDDGAGAILVNGEEFIRCDPAKARATFTEVPANEPDASEVVLMVWQSDAGCWRLDRLWLR